MNHVPAGVVVVVFVILILAVVMLAVWLVRRFVPATREGFDAEVSSQMLGVVAALFGLLLAFVVVIEYQNFSDAQDNVNREADALAAIVRDSPAFPQPAASRVRSAIGLYVRTVVDEEWPLMREGHDSERAWTAVDGVYRTLQATAPSSPSSIAFYDDSVRKLNDALDARRDRLADAGGGLPWVIAALVLVGSIVIIGYATLVGSTSVWFHTVGAGTIAIVIAFSLVVLLYLSLPFSGDLAIDSGPFRDGVLAQLSGQR